MLSLRWVNKMVEKATKHEIDNKYIIEIKGKKYITFNGLLEEGYKQGLTDLRITELQVDWEKKSAYCIAACKIGEKEVMAAGSGTQENCNSMVEDHFVEMAQTRAYARCLRTILNIDMVALDELKEKAPEGNKLEEAGRCEKCNQPITAEVKEYSKRIFGKELCRACQKKK